MRPWLAKACELDGRPPDPDQDWGMVQIAGAALLLGAGGGLAAASLLVPTHVLFGVPRIGFLCWCVLAGALLAPAARFLYAWLRWGGHGTGGGECEGS